MGVFAVPVRVLVPEAPVNEQSFFATPEGKVRAPRKISSVEPVAIPQPENDLADS